ncbi:MAG: cysteine desulfurase family protein [Sphingorhabdus sp.]
MIYLDYQATTQIAPEAFEAMVPWLKEGYANPHSIHAPGRAAAAAVEIARDQVAALLPPDGTLIFTSGATESLNLAIKGTVRTADHHIFAAAAIEHAAVLDCGEWLSQRSDVHILPVGIDGLLDTQIELPKQLHLLAVMQVNNEIGCIQPIEELAIAAHSRNAYFLCDAVQSYGRMQIPSGPDLIAISAHKIHGPKGIGALWVRNGLKLEPLIHGGGQEFGLRSGTLSPALCAGFGAAAQLAAARMNQDLAHVNALFDRAVGALPEWTMNGGTDHRYLGNLNIRRDGVDAARLISECRDIAFSAGSACASGSGRPSHVLKAIGLGQSQARSSIRLGFGRYTTEQEIDIAARIINEAAEAML